MRNYLLLFFLLFINYISYSQNELYGWGFNGNNQLGVLFNFPTKNTNSNNWKIVLGGESHSVGIKNDGTLWAWGLNTSGQVGDGTGVTRLNPVKIGNDTTWKQISLGGNHNIALKKDGSIWTWGQNTNGQLGDGTNTNKSSPIRIGSENNWKFIASGINYSFGIKNDGTLWAWGFNTNGQLGDGTTTNKNTPIKIGNDTNWTFVSCGSTFTLAQKSNGSIWTWGANNEGQLGDGTTVSKLTPTLINSDNDWSVISTEYSFSVAIKTNGSLWAWGQNNGGQLGNGTTTNILTPTQIGSDSDWQNISAGGNFVLAFKTDNSLWSWGSNNLGKLGDRKYLSRSYPEMIDSNTTWTLISAALNHSLALSDVGDLWVWGNNIDGQLGNGKTYTRIYSPLLVGTDFDWKYIAMGRYHTLGIKSNGTLWAWGDNSIGQLGDGTTNFSRFPIQIGADNKWLTVSCGELHSLGVKSDGTLWAWGSNVRGRLGDGTTTNRTSPVIIGLDSNWESVSAGWNHTLGIKKDGTLWAWGQNNSGQLGDGTKTDRLSPVKIGSDTNWLIVSAGSEHNIGIKKDGTLWAWGWNAYGQLGDGTNAEKLSPIKIGSATDWVFINANYNTSTAIKSDGTLWAWGRNDVYQLGDGTQNPKNIPTKITSATNWKQISLGKSHTLAIKTDGTLWAWGNNSYYQHGDGLQSSKSTPTKIGSDTTWRLLTSGELSSMGIKAVPVPRPLLFSPTNNSVDLSRNITLDWLDLNKANKYFIELAKDSLFNQIVGTYEETVSYVDVADLDRLQKFYWRVKGVINDEETPWSDVWNFTVGGAEAVPDHWAYIDSTGNSALIKVPINISPKLNNRDFIDGDAVGIFFQRNDSLICGGYGIWDSANLDITVWGNDGSTPFKDGFNVEDHYYIKLWDGQIGEELDCDFTLQSGNPFYTINGVSILSSLNSVKLLTQSIYLRAGWNIISTYLKPENDSLDFIWQNNIDNLVLLKNDSGLVYIPSFGINTIGKWSYKDAYQVYVNNSDTLKINGFKTFPAFEPIVLNTGWNFVSYLRTSNLSVVNSLESLVESGSLTLAKNNSGKVYIPAYNINTLGNLEPGQGYQMYLSKKDTLIYPPNMFGKLSFEELTPSPKYLIPNYYFTGSSSSFILEVNGNTGDEIGIYNKSEILIGSGVVNNGLAAMTIWGDNEQTEIIDGAINDEQLSMKYYDNLNSSLVEINPMIRDNSGNYIMKDLKYRNNGISFGKFVIDKNLDLYIELSPNPASENLQIKFNQHISNDYTLQIFNSKGNIMDEVINVIGTTYNYNVKDLASGTYTLHINLDGKIILKNFVVIK